jgi:hypothetical protein
MELVGYINIKKSDRENKKNPYVFHSSRRGLIPYRNRRDIC